MKEIRNWLMCLLCINLVIAVVMEWPVYCKISTIVNAGALLGSAIWDIARKG